MAITYTWKTNTLTAYKEYEEFSDTVYKVQWTLQGSETVASREYKSYSSGEVELSLESLSPSSYVAKNDITEENAVNWVQSALGDTYITNIKNQIESEIDEKKNSNEETFAVPITTIGG
jgi:hypothetical protein